MLKKSNIYDTLKISKERDISITYIIIILILLGILQNFVFNDIKINNNLYDGIANLIYLSPIFVGLFLIQKLRKVIYENFFIYLLVISLIPFIGLIFSFQAGYVMAFYLGSLPSLLILYLIIKITKGRLTTPITIMAINLILISFILSSLFLYYPEAIITNK